MRQALVTMIAPLRLDRLADAERAIDRLENPARKDIRDALDRLDEPAGQDPKERAPRADLRAGTHFASLHAIRSSDGERAYIVFEFSADGTEDEALARIVGAIGAHLRPVFMLASDWRDGGDLAAYLRARRVAVGGGWLDNPGVVFAGTPRMTVGRILMEARLAARISEILAAQGGDLFALERLAKVRACLKEENEPDLAGALEPASADPPYEQPTAAAFGVRLVLSFARTYLWPVAILVLALALYAGVQAAFLEDRFWPGVGAFLLAAAGVLWNGFLLTLIAVLIVGGVAFFLLGRAEARDAVDERAPDRATNAAMFARENRCAQNHMISVTQRKPGLLRWFTSRLVFWAVGEFATHYYRAGFLSDIGTIHFARWVTPPGSPDLVFLSNYGGSWESYLEDFITRAHAGLTGVWSNSIGFPRSENLIQKGATDGERFKRYARRSMAPTRFWYSAYPSLTTANIRANADIRRGLSGAMTEDEAESWLALFGSAARSVSKLVGSEIQSLVFGGLRFMPYGVCLVVDLPDDLERARQWLRRVGDEVAYNDGRRLRKKAVVTLALGATGLARLGLPKESLETFPFAFLDGMVTEARSRILGDFGDNGPEHWRWGRTRPDAALLIYGETPDDVAQLEGELLRHAQGLRMREPYRIPLKPVERAQTEAEKAAGKRPEQDKSEPFGFADGISQPVIRGTYKGLRNADPIHLVEPGEFILGYPDNRGNFPPGPTLPATADPLSRLPLCSGSIDFTRTVVENARDLGFNGSFLVIRELEQDVAGFWAYCESESSERAARLPQPYVMTPEFIAAKLVGRWKDGSSLMRHPYQSQTAERERAVARAAAGLGAEAARAAAQAPTEAQVTTRPKTAPPEAKPVEPAPRPALRGDNDYLFGTEDPEGLRCPFGAHVRRSNPRDSLDPGSADQIAISNRHRIMRVGRQYEPKDGEKPGLLFMCLNGDIERQFEFLQQSWLRSPTFHGLSCEKDPLLGDGEVGVCSYTIPTREGPLRLSPMPRFVTTRGGGYFFLPGKRLIEYLGAEP